MQCSLFSISLHIVLLIFKDVSYSRMPLPLFSLKTNPIQATIADGTIHWSDPCNTFRLSSEISPYFHSAVPGTSSFPERLQLLTIDSEPPFSQFFFNILAILVLCLNWLGIWANPIQNDWYEALEAIPSLNGREWGSGYDLKICQGRLSPWRQTPFCTSRSLLRFTPSVSSQFYFVLLTLQVMIKFTSTHWMLGIQPWEIMFSSALIMPCLYISISSLLLLHALTSTACCRSYCKEVIDYILTGTLCLEMEDSFVLWEQHAWSIIDS